MAVLTYIETDTGTNVDISAATAVGAYTSTGDKLIMVDVSIDAVAGNGDYVMYVTRQIGGSGSAYHILPQTTMAAASGLTAISGQSGWITVRNGDVLTCYVDGLAGDTSTPDWTTRWFESAVTLVTLADDAITASKFDESTAYPLKSADTGSTQVARVGADGDTLETLSGEIAAVKAETALIVADTGTDGVVVASGQTVATVTNLTNLPTMPADWVTASGLKADAVTEIQSGLALEATLTAIKAKTDNLPADPADDSDIDVQLAAIKAETAAILVDTGTTLDTKITTIDGIVDAIKLKTDLIPATPAPANEYDTELTAIQADLDNPDQYKADVSALATTAHVQEVEDKVDIVDGIADAILDDTGTSGVLLSTSALGSIFDDEAIVGTYTARDLLKIMASALAGKLSGGGTTTLTFKSVDGASDVIEAIVDANGNRTSVTLTV